MTIRTIMFFCLILLIFGCAGTGYRAENMYIGERPKGDVSVLKVGQSTDVRRDGWDIKIGLEIRAIDNIRVGRSGYVNDAFGRDFVNEVWLLPGKRIVTFRFLHIMSYAFATLWFIAEPGEAYIGKYELTPEGGVHIWIENDSTGSRVGGVVGSVDEPPSL